MYSYLYITYIKVNDYRHHKVFAYTISNCYVYFNFKMPYMYTIPVM